ncbi:MAG: sugar MFS transporter [Flavobacteriales bacterium]|nr:sugar MFS transporter [Flavobacteriales bacterium]
MMQGTTVRSADRSTNANGALAVLTSLFFLWGFITVLNDVLVPHWKELFQLSYAQSLLVQFCFFGAYFIGSLVYYFISIASGDPIERIGYKRGLMVGLGLSALGCALFAPASYLHSYAAHLVALFVLGLGFTVLQIAANPFVAIIGPAESASSRLNLAQAFNSLGTTLAPLIGGWLIFDQVDPSAAVRMPYIGLAMLLALIALVVRASRLPEPARAERSMDSNAMRHPQLRWGMVAIFCYVGAEVAVGSLIIGFLGLTGVMGLDEEVAKHYLSLYWGGAMTGRFLGAVALNAAMPFTRKLASMLVIGAAMFGLLMLLNATGPVSVVDFWPMALLILGNIAVALLARENAGRAMGMFAAVAVALLVAVVVADGQVAAWAIIAIGLFNSILWSNIFTLSIAGLGSDTAQGSSLLVMMILGGALTPWAQASIIDLIGASSGTERGFHLSFILPLACYAYLVWYGLRGSTLRSNA